MVYVRIERLNKGLKMPSGNPIDVCADNSISTASHGEIRTIHTGLAFYLPNTVALDVKPIVNDMAILNHYVDSSDNELVLVVVCSGLRMVIGKGVPVAKVFIIDRVLPEIKFTEISDGPKMVFSDSQPIKIVSEELFYGDELKEKEMVVRYCSECETGTYHEISADILRCKRCQHEFRTAGNYSDKPKLCTCGMQIAYCGNISPPCPLHGWGSKDNPLMELDAFCPFCKKDTKRNALYRDGKCPECVHLCVCGGQCGGYCAIHETHKIDYFCSCGSQEKSKNCVIHGSMA